MTSSHAQQSTSSEDDDDMSVFPLKTTIINSNIVRDVDESPEVQTNRNDGSLAVVLRDATDWLPHIKSLQETDVIILLTPVVIPISQDPNDLSDPFEPLGRSLAKRHAKIRQVPYTQR